jgi:hypothetical protein
MCYEIFVKNNTVSRNEVLQARKGKACMLWNSSSVQTESRESCNIKFFDFPQKKKKIWQLGEPIEFVRESMYIEMSRDYILH